jgi:Rieske Fe-S protein
MPIKDGTDCSGRQPRAHPSRRALVVGLGAGTAVAAALRATGARGEDGTGLQSGDRLRIDRGPLRNQYLRPDMLERNARPVTAFPIAGGDGPAKDGDRLNRILAVRLDPAEMDEETRAMAADGVLLYSALCTHQACVIAAWKQAQRHLRCHCHLSEFDALAMGAVRKGPARRPLALAPAQIDPEGFVRLAGTFNRKPGARG